MILRVIKLIRSNILSPIWVAVLSASAAVPLWEASKSTLFPDHIALAKSRGFSFDAIGMFDALEVGDLETAGAICNHKPYKRQFSLSSIFDINPDNRYPHHDTIYENRNFLISCHAWDVPSSCIKSLREIDTLYREEYDIAFFQEHCSPQTVRLASAIVIIESFAKANELCNYWLQNPQSDIVREEFKGSLDASQWVYQGNFGRYWSEFGNTKSIEKFCEDSLHINLLNLLDLSQ